MKKKEKKKSFSIGGSLLRIRRLRDRLFRHKVTGDFVKMMEPRSRPEQSLTRLWEKRLGLIVVLCVSGVFLWMFCYTSDPEEGLLTDGRYIQRPDGEESVDLTVKGEVGGSKWEKEFHFDVGEREFTDEEIGVIDQKVKTTVEDGLQGENISMEHVTDRLNLAKDVPGTGVELSWTVDEKLIRDDGSLIRSHIPKEGMDTELMLEAKWRNYKQVWHYPVHIDPPVYTEQEQSESAAKKSIRGAIRSQNTEKKIELPAEYQYDEEEKGKSYLPVLLIVGILIALPFVWRAQMKRSMESREEQLLVDHPGFINKVMLLLGAGLTLRFVIERIAGEYERELEDGGEKHYVYEELCVTMQELRDGVTEAQAVENFGKRCRLMPYMRFASLIAQNIRKGAEGLLVILEKEAMESLIERKQTALRQGEKAGTKLLFPMIVMLGLVMSIIMVPAFMTM